MLAARIDSVPWRPPSMRSRYRLIRHSSFVSSQTIWHCTLSWLIVPQRAFPSTPPVADGAMHRSEIPKIFSQ